MALTRSFAEVLYVGASATEKYTITPKVEMRFEKAYKKPVTGKTFEGEDGTRLTYALAWVAMQVHKEREGGQVIPALEAWVDTLEAVTIDRETIVPLEGSAG